MRRLLLLSLSFFGFAAVKADVVLTKRLMNLVKTSAELSVLAYEEDIPQDDKDMYQGFAFYDAEPDQALVVKTEEGYCIGAFRGTTLTWIDWKQNFDPGYADVCVDMDHPPRDAANMLDTLADPSDENQACCTTRKGFYEAYHTTYDKELEHAIRDCAKDCTNPDECVILTGHSQGGAVAAVAGLILADLNPYVITFGQPATIQAPCETITSERWYRFINTKASDNVGIMYDPIPFVPGFDVDFFGHMIVLSDDNSGVAYIGLDSQEFFSPIDVAGLASHSMTWNPNGTVTTEHNDPSFVPGYLDHITILMEKNNYPIRNNGYTAGSLCSKDLECESNICKEETDWSFSRCVGVQCTHDDDCSETTGRCESGVCISKLESCFECDEDSDCMGERCFLFRCSASNSKLMSNECICSKSEDCESGRCEGFAPPKCEARLGLGAFCNENSDCLSNYCSWYKCEESPLSSEFLPMMTSTSKGIDSSGYDDSNKNYNEKSDDGGGGGGNPMVILLGIAVTVAVGYYTVPKLIARYKGYESVPTTTLSV